MKTLLISTAFALFAAPVIAEPEFANMNNAINLIERCSDVSKVDDLDLDSPEIWTLFAAMDETRQTAMMKIDADEDLAAAAAAIATFNACLYILGIV